MEALHAPWRIDYILAPKKPAGDESIFARIAADSDDVANLVIARERTCFALMNSHPYNGGHVMVIPYKLVPDFCGLTDDETLGMMKLEDAF